LLDVFISGVVPASPIMRVRRPVASIAIAALLLFRSQSARASEEGCGDVAKSEIKVAIEPEQDRRGASRARTRPARANEVPDAIRAQVKYEEDRSRDSAKISCSVDGDVKGHEIEQASKGRTPISNLFSADQLALVDMDKSVSTWHDVLPLGPIRSRIWKVVSLGSDVDDLTVEEWTLADASKSRFLEVSRRVDESVAKDALERLTGRLRQRKIALAKEQEAKTGKTLAAISRNESICSHHTGAHR
jgi:hypothetical protein